MRRWLARTLGMALLLGAGLAALGVRQPSHAQAQPPAAAAPATSDLLARGRYLTAAGDCQACHTRPGGQAFAGGRTVATPFGKLLSANITPDRTGIGGWTADQFYRALHQGVDDDGQHLYPAFPYNYYTLLTRADSDAIFAYLKTLPAVANSPRRNQLPFPFNIRPLVAVWNWLFLKTGPFRPDPSRSAGWNRGAYLVEALGHCQACHTPKNLLGAPKRAEAFRGGPFSGWFAPDLTPNARTGLGGWSRAELVAFLKTGRNAHAAASGEMGDVVIYSTSQLTDGDLDAIATYLGAQRTSPAARAETPDRAVMRQGQAIFVDSCSACHRMDGGGVPGWFPPLKADANLQQGQSTTTLRFILAGVRSTPTSARPTPLSMPAYAWKLSDGQVAAVATFVRNSWGNAAPSVSAHEVSKVREGLTFGPGPAGSLAHPALDRPGPGTWSAADTDSRDNGTRNAGRTAPRSDGQGTGRSGGNGGADKGHPAGVNAGGPG